MSNKAVTNDCTLGMPHKVLSSYKLEQIVATLTKIDVVVRDYHEHHWGREAAHVASVIQPSFASLQVFLCGYPTRCMQQRFIKRNCSSNNNKKASNMITNYQK